MTDRDPEWDEIEGHLRGDMNINSVDIPRSTLLVGGVLWTVLAGLMAWNLTATLSIKEQQADDVRRIEVAQTKTDARVENLEGRVNKLEQQK